MQAKCRSKKTRAINLAKFCYFIIFVNTFIIFRDRVATITNVWANCIATAIIHHLSRQDIMAVDVGRNYTESSDHTVDFEVNVSVEIEKEGEEEKENEKEEKKEEEKASNKPNIS